MVIRKSTTEELELQAPQTIEAYREARSSKSAADKRAYLLEQQLEAARRSNGLMVEQMHADRDRAAALSADLDDMRAEHEAALAIVKTALDEANRKIVAFEGELKAALTSRVDAFKSLPEGSTMKRPMSAPEVSSAQLNAFEVVAANACGALRVDENGLGFVKSEWLERHRTSVSSARAQIQAAWEDSPPSDDAQSEGHWADFLTNEVRPRE